jgi:hypothetical protein
MASFMIFVRLALAIILLVWVLGQNLVTPEIALLTLSWYNITRLSLVMLYQERVRNAISGVTRFCPKTQTNSIIASASRTKIIKEAILNVRK